MHIENMNEDMHYIIPKHIDEIIAALLRFKKEILVRGGYNKECEYE